MAQLRRAGGSVSRDTLELEGSHTWPSFTPQPSARCSALARHSNKTKTHEGLHYEGWEGTSDYCGVSHVGRGLSAHQAPGKSESQTGALAFGMTGQAWWPSWSPKDLERVVSLLSYEQVA